MSEVVQRLKPPLLVGPAGKLKPPDIEDRFVKSSLNVRRYQDFNALSETGVPLTTPEMLKQILWHTQIDVLLKTLGTAFRPRIVTITTTPTEIIRPNKVPRGYVIINPAEITTNSGAVVYFASALRAPGTTNSLEVNVSGVDRMMFFLDVTVVAAGGTVTINQDTQDPTSLNFARIANAIFGGATAAVSTVPAFVGQIGIDNISRLEAVVAVNDVTFSVTGFEKGGGLGTTGTTVFLGGTAVNTLIGFPMLPGQIERLYLLDNVALFGVVASGSLTIKVFELQ